MLGTEKVGFRGFHEIFRKGILVVCILNLWETLGSKGLWKKAGHVLRAVGCSGWSTTVGCADNTVVISMCACDRGKSEALGTRNAERVSCESRLVVHVRGHALTW